MRVAVYKGVRNVVLEDRPKPVAGPGQAVVKVKYCGICGTDVHAYLHEGLCEPPAIFGHEAVGTVEELGAGVTSCKVGDRVAIGPPGNCGNCYNCLHGRSNICIHAFPLAIGITANSPGAYAEYVLVRNPKNMLLPIPDHVSFEEAVLVDVIGVSYHGIRRSNFKTGDDVVVIGTGPIGLAAIMLLKMAGAGKLIVIVRSEAKAKLALQYGADVALDQNVEGAGLADKVCSLTGGKGADIVYECAGAPQAVITAINVTRSGGQVMIIGVTAEPASLVPAQIVAHEIDLNTSMVYDATEIGMVLDLMASDRLPIAKKMVTDIIKLDDVVTKGLERLAGKSDQIKILLEPHRK